MTLENGTTTTKNKDTASKPPLQIPRDILDDLASRFIINVPVEERSDLIRICFQIELAHWFYLDFYCAAEDEKLVVCGMKYFASHIFKHIPFLNEHLPRLESIINDFKQYKMSVPTYGAILMTPDKKRVLLVQSYWAKSSWGFPKGKVNEDEDPLHCAIREVYEETGFDSSRLIRPDDFIEAVINYQNSRLYIVPNVPADTVFVPRTRKEIKACEWFQLDCLPSHKMDTVCKEALGIRANSFFMIQPFVNRLKRWLADNNNAVGGTSNGAIRLAKRNNGGTTAIAGAQAASSLPAGNKQRQRNASTGDLEVVKTEGKAIPANRPKTVAAPNNSNNLTPITSAANSQSAKQKGNFKRQLFTATTASLLDGTSSLPASNGNNTTRPQASTSLASRGITIATRPPTTAKAQPSSYEQQSIPTTATIPPTDNAVDQNNKKKQRRPAKAAGKFKLMKSQQVRPIESFLQAMNADPAIQLWKNFTFTDRDAITCTLPPFPKSVY